MSRLTATEVIALGRYLEPDFEPSSLTVSQLLGVLGYHNIKYPTPYSKPKLVQVFKDEIKAHTGRLSRQRLKAESSIASDDGITDGITGRPIGGASKASEPAPAPARRASRRLSRAPPEQDETEPPRPDPPKRRRSSAQPNLGGSSKPTSNLQPTVQPTVAEESEPDEDELPARKVSRSKKKIGGPSSRRKSLAEDSGWEDNNIFQSGAESSSPVRPSPRPKPRRPSVRKSRKSASAPPQSSPLSSPIKASRADGLPQSRFEPQLPLVPSLRSRIFEEQKPVDVMEEEIAEVQPYNDDDGEAEEDGEDIVSHDTKRANSELALPDSHDTVVAMRQEPFIPPAIQVLFWLVGLIGAILATNYKIESSSMGYCDANSETNSALEHVRAKREAVQLCNQENRTTLYVGGESPCPLLPFIPADLHSDSCTPCPDHAACRQDTVVCDSGYILRPHPLFFFIPAVASPTKVTLSASSPPNELAWKVISELMNGLPGMGSVAFPPRCVEDPKRKRHIGALGKAVEHILAHRRGELLCSGVSDEVEESEEGEAKKWGMELDGLRSKMRDMTAPHLIPTFDDMFNEAIQQLVEWGGIMISEDSEGVRYIAHKTPALSLACTVIVESRGIWRAWRVTVLGIVTAGASIFGLRSRNARKKESMKRVAEIVPTALKAIRDAEMAHHTDPITSPYSFVSSLQLRDLLLPHEPLGERDALWRKVSRVVEQNTNVRANFEEANGGDEMRVWRWIGGGAGVQRQLSPEQEKKGGIDAGSSD